jgi:CRISPR-associated exonuclease Cas4
MNNLDVSQHEDRRYLVLKGREIHDEKMVRNKDYLRKKIGCVDKEIDVYLSSEKLNLVGRVDEVLFFDDGSAAPLDYKFAEWKNRVYKTLFYQQALYALLIEEIYEKPVNCAYICYVKSKNHVERLDIKPKHKEKAMTIVKDMLHIINTGYFPEGTTTKNKCRDCTYRNLCF